MNPDCARKMEQGLGHKDTKGLFCLCSDTKRVVLDRGGAKCGKRKKIADVEDPRTPHTNAFVLNPQYPVQS